MRTRSISSNGTSGPKKPDPRVVAKKLVAAGRLTHFQANYLFTGKSDSLLVGLLCLDGSPWRRRHGNGVQGQELEAWPNRRRQAGPPGASDQSSAHPPLRARNPARSAKLDHANIVRTIDADEVGGNHLLVMEYVPGARDLHKLIRENGPLPIAHARRYLHQVAMGLQHAFEQGLVHRDIKPQNLLVSGGDAVAKTPALAGGGPPAPVPSSAADTVKILDFGLALFSEGDGSTTLTKEGAVMGTVDYVAPEQLVNSHCADIRADLYSLGCTMYYILTGQVPFAGRTLMEKMYKHQYEEAQPVEQLRVETPPELGDIVRKLMAKQPEDRYQTPEALMRDLEALAAGAPASASSSSGVRLKPAPPAVPIAVLAPLQAERDTENPFAGMGQGDTASDAPVSVRLQKAPMPVRWKNAGAHAGHWRRLGCIPFGGGPAVFRCARPVS